MLLSQPGITSLVPQQTIDGTVFSGIFNEYPTQGFRLPFILISVVSTDPYACLDGTQGMMSFGIDIDCYANRFDKSVAISNAVQSFLNDYTGPAGSNCMINAVILKNKSHSKLYEDGGRDTREHVDSLSYQIQAT